MIGLHNLLVAGLDDFAPFAVLVIMIISGIVNFIKQKREAADNNNAPANRPKRPVQKDLRNEIEQFLNEVRGDAPKQKPPQPPSRDFAEVVEDDFDDEDDFIEVVADEEIQRRTVPPRTVAPSFEQRRTVTKSGDSPRQPLSEHHLRDEHKFESTVGKHVSQYMREGKVSQHVSEHLSHDINKSVTSHLGSFEKEAPTWQEYDVPSESDASQELLALLRSPGGIRQAILVNEVLSRPLGLRNKS